MSEDRVTGTLRLKKPSPDPAAVDREIAELLKRGDEEEQALAVALLAMEDY